MAPQNTLPSNDPFYNGLSDGDPFADGVDDIPDNFPGLNQATKVTRQGDVHWKLETIENKDSNFQNFKLQGQFPVGDEGIGYTVNAVVPEAASAGMFHPFIQWVRGQLEVVTLPVLFYSRDTTENITYFFQQAKRLMEDMGYGRPPLIKFTYGSILSLKVLVRGFGEVKIARPKPDGSARRIDFTVTMARYNPYDVSVANSSADLPGRFHESKMVQVSGERRMYEVIARREFGPDASIYGDRLRKRNRAEPFAVSDGGLTKVPSSRIILAEFVTPEYHGFNDGNEDTAKMIQAKFSARNARTLVV
jgi:hypothetical protein